MSTTDPREQPQRPSGGSSGAPSGSSSSTAGSSTAGSSAAAPSRPATPSAGSRASSAAASSPAPSAGPGATPTPASPTGAARGERTSGGGGGAALGIAALVLGLVLGAGGMKLIDNAGDGGSGGGALAGSIDEARYQAVILTNDKVYFGRLTEVNDTFFRLDEAFFLRETRESPEAEPVRALLPINRELHAPENSMLIRQDEVVLVENLDEESPLLEEIERQTGESGTEAPTSDSGER